MKIIENYGRAIENSDENLFNEVFAPQVRVEIPVGKKGERIKSYPPGENRN